MFDGVTPWDGGTLMPLGTCCRAVQAAGAGEDATCGQVRHVHPTGEPPLLSTGAEGGATERNI